MANTQETQGQDTQKSEEARTQSSFDTSFIEQMGGPAGSSSMTLGYDLTSQVVQSYFDQVESTTRQARRMADLWAQSLILQQTTSQIARVIAPVVCKQVIDQLRANPAWVRDLTESHSHNR